MVEGTAGRMHQELKREVRCFEMQERCLVYKVTVIFGEKQEAHASDNELTALDGAKLSPCSAISTGRGQLRTKQAESEWTEQNPLKGR